MGARAKIFSHGGSQAVRLPKAFRFSEGEVSVRREGAAVILEPKSQGGRELWDRLDALRGDGRMDYVAQVVLDDEDLGW